MLELADKGIKQLYLYSIFKKLSRNKKDIKKGLNQSFRNKKYTMSEMKNTLNRMNNRLDKTK